MRSGLQVRFSRWWRRLMPPVTVVVAAIGLGCLACNAPFIPVPPPENVFVQQTLTDSGGVTRTVWITQGKPDARAAGAKFYIFNDAFGAGVIVEARADGSYTAPPLDGTMGDHVFLYYTTPAGADSEAACRVLSEGDPAPHCP